jgi:hypothetical protein
MTNFAMKLNKGTDKYKGMIPLKCFNCGGIVHFTSKFPHKNKDNEEEVSKMEKNIKRETREETKGNSSRKVSTQRRKFLIRQGG